MLEEKAGRYGRRFSRVDRWFPSTRMCSVCGAVGEKQPLRVREWTCACGTVHDRDLNAAVNILAAGRAESSTPVELVSVSTSVARPAVKQEPAGSAAQPQRTGISRLRAGEDVKARTPGAGSCRRASRSSTGRARGSAGSRRARRRAR
ncbi:zinc ribbon domain-containing protein [Nocardia sp. NPDC055321]